MKRYFFVSVFLASFALIFTAKPVDAKIVLKNKNTGFKSINLNFAISIEKTKVKVNNIALIGNFVGIGSSTGGNTADKNTGDATVKSGNIGTTVWIKNYDINLTNIKVK